MSKNIPKILHLPGEEKVFYTAKEPNRKENEKWYESLREAGFSEDEINEMKDTPEPTDEEMVDFLNKIGIEARLIYLNENRGNL